MTDKPLPAFPPDADLLPAAPPGTAGLGHIVLWRREDGQMGIGNADPLIGVSLALMAQRDPAVLDVTDGLVTFSGVGPDDQPREVRYRAVGMQLADPRALAENEGGYVLLERVA